MSVDKYFNAILSKFSCNYVYTPGNGTSATKAPQMGLIASKIPESYFISHLIFCQ